MPTGSVMATVEAGAVRVLVTSTYSPVSVREVVAKIWKRTEHITSLTAVLVSDASLSVVNYNGKLRLDYYLIKGAKR